MRGEPPRCHRSATASSKFLHVFARIVADQLEREEFQGHALQLESQASAAATLIAAVDAVAFIAASTPKPSWGTRARSFETLGSARPRSAGSSWLALLHDIGKVAIPDAVLVKAGPLTDEEGVVMRTHPIASGV